MMGDDTHYPTILIAAFSFIACIMFIFAFAQISNFATASTVDPSNLKTDDVIGFYTSMFPFLLPSEKSFVQNESYLKQKFDGLANFDQFNHNRGIDFSKCYEKDSHELDDAISSDTHYVKIRGETPDEALKTISLPGVMLNAGFSIPDPKQLYVSEFRQISPNEYKMWIITKEPVVETIDGALENTCRVSYYY